MSRRDLIRFLYIAHGSASEVECESAISTGLGFLPPKDHAKLQVSIVQIKRMLGTLIRRVRDADNHGKGSDR
jgi:four helix bundle protein